MNLDSKIKLNMMKCNISHMLKIVMLLVVFSFYVFPAVAADVPDPPKIPNIYEEMNNCNAAGNEWRGAISNPSCVEREDSRCGLPEDVPAFYKDMEESCWFCHPFVKVIYVAQKVAYTIYDVVDSAVVGLIAACFTIWLTIKIISYIAVFSQKDVGEFYTEIGKKTVRVVFGVVAVFMGTNLWQHTIGPLSDGMFDYGTLVLGNSVSIENVGVGAPISDLANSFVGDGETPGGLLSEMNKKLMNLMATGWILFTASFITEDLGCSPFVYTNLFFSSIPMLLFSAVMLLIIPLRCIDILYRLAIWLCLLPLFIFAWVFSPFTNRYFTKGVNTLIGVMLNILLICIIVSLCQDLISKELRIVAPSTSAIRPLRDELLANYVLNLGAYLKIISLLIFSFFVVSQSTELTQKLADTNPAESGFSKAAFKAPQQNIKAAGRLAKSGYNMAKTGAKKIAGKYDG